MASVPYITFHMLWAGGRKLSIFFSFSENPFLITRGSYIYRSAYYFNGNVSWSRPT